MTIKLKDVVEAMESYAGYCLNCEDWTHDCCEPDAERYICPVCTQAAVYGAEELLIMGLVTDDKEQ